MIGDRNYNNVHAWLRYNYGPADRCENPDCPKITVNFNWALLKGKTYEKKRDNFQLLCRSCHAKYDCTEITRHKRSLLQKGTKMSENTRAALLKANTGRIKTIDEIERTKASRKASYPNVKGIRFITYQGKTLPIVDWARLKGIKRSTLFTRLKNMPFEVAIEKVLQKQDHSRRTTVLKLIKSIKGE